MEAGGEWYAAEMPYIRAPEKWYFPGQKVNASSSSSSRLKGGRRAPIRRPVAKDSQGQRGCRKMSAADKMRRKACRRRP